MTVYGIAMVKDEADIIAATVGHMASQVDRVIVADNGSTDGTREILAGLDVDVLDDPEVGYYQSRKMTGLARLALDEGADWVVPFDADEWWYSPFGRITEVLDKVPAEWLVASADLFDHVATGLDLDHPDPTERLRYRRREPAQLPKVAARGATDLVIEQGNHGAHYSIRPAYLKGQLVVRHFPYRSPEQFVRKARNGAAAYAATDLPEQDGAHWRQYGGLIADGGDEVGHGIFRRWFWQPDATGLILDPVSCL